MATSSVFVPYELPGDLLRWLEEQAEREDIEPGALLHRAVERERRRLTPETPQLKPHTKRTGVTGSRSRVGAGEWIGADVADAAEVSHVTVSKAIADGIIKAKSGQGRKGVPTVFTFEQARAAVGVLMLRRVAGNSGAVDSPTVFDLLEAADDTAFVTGRFLVAGIEPRIVAGAALPSRIVAAGSAVAVLNLGSLGVVRRMAA